MKFRLGGVVTLKSGGPDMVMDRLAEDGSFVCAWFDGKRLKKEAFRPETLNVTRKPRTPKAPDFTLRFLDGEGNEVSRMKLLDPKLIERTSN
jgi:uncharacterized protein YodC (DUF2158 family)